MVPAVGQVAEPTEPHARELLEQYITVFENSDPAALTELLCKDARVGVTPSRSGSSAANAMALAAAGPE
jgi:RNA polymerase sigma-70 factor, ECF subfamily